MWLAFSCIWQPNDNPDINPPWCTVPDGYGYEVNGDPVDTALGFTLNLARKQGQTSYYGGDIDNIRLSVEYWTESIVRIKVYYNIEKPTFKLFFFSIIWKIEMIFYIAYVRISLIKNIKLKSNYKQLQEVFLKKLCFFDWSGFLVF